MLIDRIPEKNTIMFVWFNHYAGILLKTPTKTLVIDPVDVKPRSLQHIDAIFVTHEHYDHLDQRLIVEIQKNTGCRVIADPASSRGLRHILPPGKLEEIHAGAETKIGDVSVRAERSQHPAAQPVTFIITSEDGVKIFHTSDSLPFPEMATLIEKEKLDVVFCTIGIAPQASPETGADIAILTKPKVAVPYHTGSTKDQSRFAELLKKELPKTTCLI